MLRKRTEDRSRPLRPDEIVVLVDSADPMELWRGCITLPQGWRRGCTQPEVLVADLIDHANRRGTVARAIFAAAGIADYPLSLTQPAEPLD